MLEYASINNKVHACILQASPPHWSVRSSARLLSGDVFLPTRDGFDMALQIPPPVPFALGMKMWTTFYSSVIVLAKLGPSSTFPSPPRTRQASAPFSALNSATMKRRLLLSRLLGTFGSGDVRLWAYHFTTPESSSPLNNWCIIFDPALSPPPPLPFFPFSLALLPL
jgi:hypothetical protein